MKLDQAVQVHREYHRMNSQKSRHLSLPLRESAKVVALSMYSNPTRQSPGE